MNRRQSLSIRIPARLRPVSIAEALERRVLFNAVSESEPNDTAATANTITVSASPTVVLGTASQSDHDFFKFTLNQRSGVFFDVDSREIGLSTSLDSVLELFDSTGATSIASNDDGRDFDTFALNDSSDTSLQFGDSALYADLAAGTYVLKLSAILGSGPYQLKLTADTTYATTVPAFNSLAGATETLYLDFDGYSASGDAWNGGGAYAIPAFDFNGNASEWTPAERMAIENTWRVVADAFAPFNVNVTTSYTGAYTPEASAYRIVIGNSNGSQVKLGGADAAAIVDSYNSGGAGSKTGFVFAYNIVDPDAGVSGQIMANGIEIGNAASYAFGRALGLAHYGGTNPQLNGFMHIADFGLNRERWVSGDTHSDEPPVVAQNDLAVITKPANTITFRSDDHGDTRPAATALTASGSTYSSSGIIHQVTDVDFFRFSGSGETTITLDIPEHLGHLDGQLYLHDAADTEIGSSLPSNRLGGSITVTLPAAGDYYVAVRSDGGPGEIGQYDLRISTTVAGTISGRVFRDVTLNNLYEPGAGDMPIGGVTVFLDDNDNGTLDDGERSTTSAAPDGTYTFTGLLNNAYNVRQQVPSGYVSDVSHTIVVSGSTHANTNFGSFPITYLSGGGNDAYTVQLQSGDATRIEIIDGMSGLTYSAPKSLVPSLSFTTADGDDLLSVNYANGDPVPAPGGIVFDAGSNATSAPGDRLVITGSASGDNYSVTNSSIASDGASIAYSLVEDIIVNGGDGDDTLTLSAVPSAGVAFNGGTNAAFTDTLNVNAGTYTFNADASLGTANLIVNLNDAAGAVLFNTSQHLEALNITGGVATVSTNGANRLVLETISIAGGQLDLRDNDMIVHSGTPGTRDGTKYGGITGYIASGYNFTSWNGNGIITSMPAARTGATTVGISTGRHVLGLGAADTAVWQGESITGNSVLIKYTYAGDANLDGQIDAGDYGIIDNFVQIAGASGYGNGDFNYDGFIDAGDYGIIDNNVQAQGLPL